MPKQSDDLTQKGDEVQKTKKGLKIPVPSREQISDALRKASQKVGWGVYPAKDETQPPESPAPKKR